MFLIIIKTLSQLLLGKQSISLFGCHSRGSSAYSLRILKRGLKDPGGQNTFSAILKN